MIHNRRFVVALVGVIYAVALTLAHAQQPSTSRTSEQKQSYRKEMETADQKIADEVKAHSELMREPGIPHHANRSETDRIATNAAGKRLDVEAVPGVRH